MTKETLSQEAVLLDYCSVCLKKMPPVKAFSRVCAECSRKINYALKTGNFGFLKGLNNGK